MLWEGNRQIQEYTNDFVFTTVYDQDSFEPVSRLVQDRQDTSQIKVYHYHNNHLGTPQELTDECGEVVWCNYEFAWGGRYTHFYKEQFLNNCAILEHELQPIRFQGQFYDVETGLHYNRFRYYDSDVGMFIQRDPIGLLGGVNVFQYAPNPIGWVDPLGLCVKPISSNNKANSASGAKLKEHLRQQEKYGSGNTRELPDGRIRYYGELKPASQKGEMAGLRTVREWNPNNNQKRTWMETIDHNGKIRQIRPDTKFTNNQKIHYRFDSNGSYIGTKEGITRRQIANK